LRGRDYGSTFLSRAELSKDNANSKNFKKPKNYKIIKNGEAEMHGVLIV
jgi:hypothetical protein